MTGIQNKPYRGYAFHPRDEFEASLDAHRMVRFGKKDYGFIHVPRYDYDSAKLAARYKCSYLEAQRRFTVLLITRRMKTSFRPALSS
jgi:hypothetical protein